MTEKYKNIPTSGKTVDFEDDVVEVKLEDVVPEAEPIIEEKAIEPKEPEVKAPPRKSRSQERIQQLVREKQAVIAERDKILAEKESLRKEYETKQQGTKESHKTVLEDKIKLLTHQMIEATKAGEAEQVVALQDLLFDAKTELRDLAKELKEPAKVEATPESPKQPDIAEKAQQWIHEHPSFFTDEMFHNAALVVNNQLLKAGYDVNSDEFYEELNTRLKKRFPEAFVIEEENDVQLKVEKASEKEAPVDVKPKASKTEQTVSGSSRPTNATSSPQPRKVNSVTLTPDDIDQAERWGLTLEQMARRIAHVEKHRTNTGYVPILMNN